MGNENINNRYLRKEVIVPEIGHHKDCYISVSSVCTCGLLHDLNQQSNPSQIYKSFIAEKQIHDHVIQSIGANKPDFTTLLKHHFDVLNEEKRIKCLIEIGFLKSPKKIASAAMNDIVKLAKQSNKLNALWKAVMKFRKDDDRIPSPFKDGE